jgi:hypothetical protein
MKYNPYKPPDPESWLELPESDRINAILAYHLNDEKLDFEGLNLHCIIQCTVENQAAMGNETPVQQTLERLMKEGLDRHEAVHAIGSVLGKYIWKIGKKKISGENINELYFEDLRHFSAQKWYDENSDLN